MKTKKQQSEIENRFWKFLRNNPFYSTYVCYAAAIWGRNIPERVIENFFSLADKEDYDERNRELILKTLYFLTKDEVKRKDDFKIKPEEREHLLVKHNLP